MKKTTCLYGIIATTIMLIAITIVSCQKEKDTLTLQTEQSTLARIIEFQRHLDAVESNHCEKTVTYMSIADAVWNIEALFNYTYAHPNDFYGQTVCNDTTLYLQVCANDSVTLSDLYVFNGHIYEAVLALYQAVDLDNKQFIILDVEAGVRNGNLQAIKLLTVQGSVKGDTPQPPEPQMWEPFDEGILWYYGEDHENSNGDPIDAADTLSKLLNSILVLQAPPGTEYIYSNIKTKQTQLGENYANPHIGYPSVTPRYCEFYKEYPTPNDYWLNSDQMNYYYFGERHLVLNILPNDANDPVPSGHSLFQIIVNDQKTNENNVVLSIGHHTRAFYGHRDGIAKNNRHTEDL